MDREGKETVRETSGGAAGEFQGCNLCSVPPGALFPLCEESHARLDVERRASEPCQAKCDGGLAVRNRSVAAVANTVTLIHGRPTPSSWTRS